MLHRELTIQELVQAIRVDIVGELEAIIGYEAHASATSDDRVKKILYHIADEERQHVGELQQLLFLLNPAEQQQFEKGKQAVQQQAAQGFQAPMQ